MRRAILSACILLLSAGSSAVAATSERAALLERLRQALPVLVETLPVRTIYGDDAREVLLPLNPGREATVESVAGVYGDCAFKVLGAYDFVAPVVAAADRAGFSDADLVKVLQLYEDPDFQRILRRVGTGSFAPPPSDLDIKAGERVLAMAADPVLQRFADIVGQENDIAYAAPQVTAGFDACDEALLKAAEEAGLKVR